MNTKPPIDRLSEWFLNLDDSADNVVGWVISIGLFVALVVLACVIAVAVAVEARVI